jgi:hypothetical protein
MTQWQRAPGSYNPPFNPRRPKYVPWTTFTSETFSGADAVTLTGRSTDALLGGAPAAWTGSGGAWGITGQQLVRGPSNPGDPIAMSLNVPALPNVSAAIKVVAEPAGSFYLGVRRPAASGSQPGYYCRVASSGLTVSLTKQTGVGTGHIVLATAPYALGQRVGVRALGTQISLMVNGAAVATVADTSITAAGYVGVMAGSAITAFTIDDLVIRTSV